MLLKKKHKNVALPIFMYYYLYNITIEKEMQQLFINFFTNF